MPNIQHNLFRNDAPDWEQDDEPTAFVARVVFPRGVDGAFDYRVPKHLAEEISAGLRVIVPLGRGNRETLGYCIDAAYREVKSQRLKEMISIVDPQRLLSDKMLRLTEWIADYYLCPQGQVLEAVLPAGVRDHAGTRLASVLYVPDDYQPKLAALAKLPNAKSALLTSKQQQVFNTLLHSEVPLTANELSRAAKCSMAPIQHLKRLGLFRVRTERRQTSAMDDTQSVPRESPHELNPPQKTCFEKICEALRRNEHCTFLLHGVTGSGKTEVYIRTIDEVVRSGRQAIILVPEISLTPQTVGRFRSRFDHVAVLHSHLTDAERRREWQRIASGSVQVVVGARSAVFAPLPNLGVIIIDEEHENSFKQDTAPRYHAREVSKRRAEEEHVPLILGSATPSLESWHRAVVTKEYTLLSMPHRVRNLPLPHVSTIDLRTADRGRDTRGAIHRRLHAAISTTLSQNGQVILMLNRRGFSTHIQCPACGEVVKCPDCEVSLTHHQTADVAVCHYCDYQIPAPPKCPKCAFPGIRYSGFGTQKLEQELKQRFPHVPLLRMDTDTMQGHGTHEKALSQFREGKVRILLGTQMIAKGLDFPNVTLVGVISADTALHLPDFRASERTFHLITQVAGRTGRGERGGQVIVQTFNPDHAAIRAATQHDYFAFVKSELPMRELLGYPPYSRMARFVVRGPNETTVLDFAKQIADSLCKQAAETGLKCRLLGPAPAPFVKLRGNYRYHIHVHYANDSETSERMRNVIRLATARLKPPIDTLWIVDIDPLDML
ncbi:MAG: primosomal protein N' [Planctomycetaceae bacterium]|jgi:primosomal protein N' (replication factor Y)|nr:primosomal protein N' [Planctomycetaceae bacterium]